MRVEFDVKLLPVTGAAAAASATRGKSAEFKQHRPFSRIEATRQQRSGFSFILGNKCSFPNTLNFIHYSFTKVGNSDCQCQTVIMCT